MRKGVLGQRESGWKSIKANLDPDSSPFPSNLVIFRRKSCPEKRNQSEKGCKRLDFFLLSNINKNGRTINNGERSLLSLNNKLILSLKETKRDSKSRSNSMPSFDDRSLAQHRQDECAVWGSSNCRSEDHRLSWIGSEWLSHEQWSNKTLESIQQSSLQPDRVCFMLSHFLCHSSSPFATSAFSFTTNFFHLSPLFLFFFTTSLHNRMFFHPPQHFLRPISPSRSPFGHFLTSSTVQKGKRWMSVCSQNQSQDLPPIIFANWPNDWEFTSLSLSLNGILFILSLPQDPWVPLPFQRVEILY